MRAICLCVVMLTTMAAPMAQSAQPTLTPGLWEITIRTELPAPMPAMTTTVCIFKDEIEKREKPPKAKATDDCKVVSGGLAGNVLAYVTKCGKRNDTATSRFTFDGDKYEGVVDIKADGREIRQVHSGRRIGDCEEPVQPSTERGD